jgi:hypothetical protein
MKAQKKNGQGLYRQRRNNRWRWMAGATAAGVSASHASAITINLLNNYISATDGNHLNAELTGDGHPELTIASAGYARYSRTLGTTGYGSIYRVYTFIAGVRLNGVTANAFWSGDYAHGTARLGSKTASLSGSVQSLVGTIPIFFKDLHINGGAPTTGSLEVTVYPGAVIQLDSLTYTSNTLDHSSSRAVPDQGSSLPLLAMGAGGVLALRRSRAAHGRS